MFRPLLLSLAAALILAQAGPAQKAAAPKTQKSAFDKATLEAYVRHLYVLGPDLKVSISDPKPSAELQGFKDVTVHMSQGTASQDLTLLVSNDGSRIVQGSVYDIGNNPFKRNLDKLKTQFQPNKGTAGAPVVLVEFSDMECPYCKVQAEMLEKNLLAAYPTQVRLYFKDFPIQGLHPWAKSAAIAGRCVFRQEPAAFWTYQKTVFSKQDAITPDNLKSQVMDWAKTQQGIDALQLNKCIDEKETEKEVDANMEEARALGVDGTPTLFVNGRRLPSGIEWAELKRVIDYEIEYQKTAKNAGEDCGCETTLSIPGLPTQTPVSPLKKK
jgi:protein-disulfide isomerase